MKKIDIKGALIKSLGTGGGAILAASANKIDFIQKLNTPVRGAIKVAIGALIPSLMGKGKKSEIVSDMGSGMIAVGAMEIYNGLVAKDDASKAITISGVPSLPSLGEYPISRMYVDETKNTLGDLPTLGEAADDTY